MRLRSWVILMTGLLTAIPAMADTLNTVVPVYPPRTGGNYSGPRWYGYFFNNGLVSANAAHTNVTMIGVAELNDSDRVSHAIAAILPRLKEAQNNGVQAMVDVEAIVFAETGSKGDACFGNDPTAATDFQALVTALEHPYPDQPGVHYLIPNDPVHSTVSSFYLADEPDRSCNSSLEDDFYYVLTTTPGGQVYLPHQEANPSLTNAITAIRGTQDTANFPLVTIVTETLASDMPYGISLFDWVGLDDYSAVVPNYLDDFTTFEANALAGTTDDAVGGTTQYYFLVPLVSYGVNNIGVYANSVPLQRRFNSDSEIIGVMPFKWSPLSDANGMNANSSWLPGYIAFGASIKAVGAPSSADIMTIVDYSILQ